MTDYYNKKLYYQDGSLNTTIYYKDDDIHKDNGPAIIYYYPNGKIKLERWIKNGLSHNDNGPAFKSYYENGKVCEVWYYLNDKRHRIDGPANIEYFSNGKIHHEVFYLNDNVHNINGPAVVDYSSNGNIIRKNWYVEGRMGNPSNGPQEEKYFSNKKLKGVFYSKTENRPSITRFYYSNGNLKEDSICKNNIIHKIRYYKNEKISFEKYEIFIPNIGTIIAGPHQVSYHTNGQIQQQKWLKNDMVHRLDGPAVIMYDKQGKITRQLFYIDSEKISKKEFEKIKKQRELIEKLSGII